MPGTLAAGRDVRGLLTVGLAFPRGFALMEGEPRGVGDCVLRIDRGREACMNTYI